MTPLIFSLLIIGPLILGLYAQSKVSRAFGKYKKVPVSSGLTGREVAGQILKMAGIADVEVVEINGLMGDHYDPMKKRLCLSSDVYHTPSVASVGIAAHEAGHAIQHARAYHPLKLRMSVVPVTQFASQILPFVIIGGIIFQITGLILVGIICYAVLALFQLITLPVEFDASKRAKIILQEAGIVKSREEISGVQEVLGAAAMTYVAAFVAALGNLIYLFLLRR
jgi:Zn-dependent membrane protease YugP